MSRIEDQPSSLREALLRAAEQRPDVPSELIDVIKERSELLTANLSVAPSVVFETPIAQDPVIEETHELESEGSEPEGLDTSILLGGDRMRPRAQQPEQEISERPVINPNRSSRIETKTSLRILSTELSQRPAIVEKKPLDQEEQAPLSEEEQQRLARRRIADAQRAANREKKAAKKSTKKPGNEPLSAPQRIQNPEENSVSEPQQTQNPEEERAYEDLKRKYTEIGTKFFFWAFNTEIADSRGVGIKQLWEEWDEVNKQFVKYPLDQRVELLENFARGMHVTEYTFDPKYAVATRAQGVEAKLKPRNYLLYGIGKLTYESTEQWQQMINFIDLRAKKDGQSWRASCEAFADWIVFHPNHTKAPLKFS